MQQIKTHCTFQPTHAERLIQTEGINLEKNNSGTRLISHEPFKSIWSFDEIIISFTSLLQMSGLSRFAYIE